MTQRVEHLYLSPHLDDVALSCGGRVWQQAQAGRSVVIVTVTAGDPPPAALSAFAQQQHAQWGLAVDAVAARRAEDARACAILGAEYVHWDWPDCIYRTDPLTGAALYEGDEAIFGDVAPVESERVVAELVRRLGGYSAESITIPLTVGHHVDHLLVRAAAERLWSPDRLTYYEDIPYAHKPGAVAAVVADPAWRSAVCPLDADALAAKLDAVAAFASQLPTLFGDETAMRRDVAQYVAATGGERVWWRAPVLTGRAPCS